MNIAVLTPSRGRPDRFREMVDAINDTAYGHIRVYLATDDDDPMYPIIPGVRSVRGPRDSLVGWTNDLAGWAIHDGADVLASFGDDHRPRTMGWDVDVAAAFEAMGSGLVYTADGLQDERLPTAPFWSADIIGRLGWFFPPTLEHLYADNYWLRLANDLGRRTYLPEVLIEHLHPSTGKAPEDDLTREIDACYERDKAAFELFVQDQHQAALARARAAL